MAAEPSRTRDLMARAATIERLVYPAIGRAITRRPWKGPDDAGFHYHSQTLVLLIAFIVVSAVELVVVDVLVHRWLWLRIPLLIVGIWGVVWMVGLLCVNFMRPHLVGPDGIRVRDAFGLDAHLPWQAVHSVAVKARNHPPKTPRVFDDDTGRTLLMHVNDKTDIEIVLAEPTRVSLPGLAPTGGEQTIARARLWADQPKHFLAAVRQQLSAAPEGGSLSPRE